MQTTTTSVLPNLAVIGLSGVLSLSNTPYLSQIQTIALNLPPSSIDKSQLSLNPDTLIIDSLDPSIFLPKIPDSIHDIYISLPEEFSLQVLESLLQSSRFKLILIDGPFTFSNYHAQRLIYLQSVHPNTQVIVNDTYRFLPQISDLHEKLTQAKESGAKITSISITTTEKKPLSTEYLKSHLHGTQELDLLFYLTQEKINAVRTLSDKPVNELAHAKFTIFSGNLTNEALFTIKLQNNPETSQGLLKINISLTSGESITESIELKKEGFQGIYACLDNDNWGKYPGLKETGEVIRAYECALQSLKTGLSVTLKHKNESIVPVRTVGTATFLDTGLFVPVQTNKKISVSGIYSNKTEKIKEIFTALTRTGEPVEYITSYEELIKNPFTQKGLFYVPSIVGRRKNAEMLHALQNGYIVLAEKPAFANAEAGKEFLAQLDDNLKQNLFFGWHYQHHFAFRKLLKELSENKFGKISKIRTYFSVPIFLRGGRLFDPATGGAGLDIFSYNLHCTMLLNGFEHGFEVVDSEIKSAKELNPNDKILEEIDFEIKAKVKFENGAEADLHATFDSENILHSEAEILFENGTEIFYKEFVHTQNIVNMGFMPVVIKRKGDSNWENYLTGDELSNPEYKKTTYEQQIEFMRRLVAGEEKYDMGKDLKGLGVEANVRLHQVLDEIFVKGGFKIKTGAI